MDTHRDERIVAILAAHNLDAADAFHILIKALSHSHLRTIYANKTAERPAPTIMQAVDLAVYNEHKFNVDYVEENDPGDDKVGDHEAMMSLVLADRAEQQRPLLQVLRECQALAEQAEALEVGP